MVEAGQRHHLLIASTAAQAEPADSLRRWDFGSAPQRPPQRRQPGRAPRAKLSGAGKHRQELRDPHGARRGWGSGAAPCEPRAPWGGRSAGHIPGAGHIPDTARTPPARTHPRCRTLPVPDTSPVPDTPRPGHPPDIPGTGPPPGPAILGPGRPGASAGGGAMVGAWRRALLPLDSPTAGRGSSPGGLGAGLILRPCPQGAER